jgi:hypothetical protein
VPGDINVREPVFFTTISTFSHCKPKFWILWESAIRKPENKTPMEKGAYGYK